MIILDTNVVSDGLRPRPTPQVTRWLDDQDLETLYLCTPVLAELCFGMEQLPQGRYRAGLAAAIDRFETSMFRGRILPVDAAAAHEYGRIAALRRRSGRPIAPMDAMIAAVALANEMAVATRDAAGFSDLGLDVIDPFDYGPATP